MIPKISSYSKQIISITLIWLFNIAGIIGIIVGYEDWFISLTPLHLLVYIGLIFFNSENYKKILFALLIPFTIGVVAEYLGVNYGFIFGTYQYGERLGYKILGVPLMIGVNWAILVYSTAAIAQKISGNPIISSLIGALLMVALDIIIEVSAPRFDFWEFQDGIIPLQNYMGWFIIACIAHILFQKVYKIMHYTLSIHIFIAIFVFFTTFLFF